jgi:hypothetical protein
LRPTVVVFQIAFADATDLKLRFYRFLGFAGSIKSSAIYPGKLPEFSNFVPCERAGRNKITLAEILAHEALDFRDSIHRTSNAAHNGLKIF